MALYCTATLTVCVTVIVRAAVQRYAIESNLGVGDILSKSIASVSTSTYNQLQFYHYVFFIFLFLVRITASVTLFS